MKNHEWAGSGYLPEPNKGTLAQVSGGAGREGSLRQTIRYTYNNRSGKIRVKATEADTVWDQNKSFPVMTGIMEQVLP